jgi:hypothetical protein
LGVAVVIGAVLTFALGSGRDGPDASAAGVNSIQAVDAGAFDFTSLRLDSAGFPVIGYYDRVNRSLKVGHCDDANCVPGGDSVVTVDAPPNSGGSTSLVLDSSGFPVLSHIGSAGGLRVIHCDDANCAPGATRST